MQDDRQEWCRLAFVAHLADMQPGIGRTALMKLAYLAQEVKGVSLGYDFRLYTYGPYDATVLDDLAYAQALGAVQTSSYIGPAGTPGYEIRPGAGANSVRQRAAGFLGEHEADINWVVQEFGKYSAADLELISTLIYVDREWSTLGRQATPDDLIGKVAEIKPHFARSRIHSYTALLHQKRLLTSI